MNPALVNYLQQQTGAPQQGQTAGVQPPSAAPYNPFNSGITTAIESARMSLGMSQDQQNKALRGGIAAFGNNIGNQPKVSGFLENLGQIGRAILPAVGAYQNEEANASLENNQMANQILNRQAQEQARLAQEEERTWRRDITERQFEEAQNQRAEQIRHHKAIEQFKNEQLKNKNQGEFIDFEGKSYRKLNKKQIDEAEILEGLTNENANALKNINKKFKNLQKNSDGNLFNPVGGYAEYANPVKGLLGRFSGNESLRKETADRQVLAAELGKLNTTLEAVKNGGGKLGVGMYDRLKPFFPDIEHDDLPTFKSKLAEVTKLSNEQNKAAKIRHKYGISYHPPGLEEDEAEDEEETQGMSELPRSNNQEWPEMVNPETGKLEEVHPEDVEQARAEGWK